MGEIEIFSTRIKQLRDKMGMTQKEFSEYLGIKQQTLSGYERNSTKPPLDLTKDIAEKCHVSIDWLCGLSDKESYNKEVETYTDVISLLFALSEIKNLNAKIFSFDDFNAVLIGFNNKKINKFFKDWLKIKKLYDEKIIDDDMYQPWLKSKLEEYNRSITNSPDYIVDNFIEMVYDTCYKE